MVWLKHCLWQSTLNANYKEGTMINCGEKVLEYEVAGKNLPKPHTQFKTANDYKKIIKEVAKTAACSSGWVLCHRDMPVAVEIINYRNIPKMLPKWYQKAALNDQIVPLTKASCLYDLAGDILDAMTGVVYEDDAQVFKLSCEAKYSDVPRAVVKVIGYYTNIGDIKEAAMKNNVRLAADVRAAAKRVAKAKGGK